MQLKKANVMGWEIEGQTVLPCARSLYWYFWGSKPFDIRNVRQAAGMKRDYAHDTKGGRCDALEKTMMQLNKISADHDFKEIINKAKEIDKERALSFSKAMEKL
jgi:hypothetical protein